MKKNLVFLTLIFLITSACNLEAKTINLVVEEKKYEADNYIVREEKKEKEFEYQPLDYSGVETKKDNQNNSFIKSNYKEVIASDLDKNLTSSKKVVNELTEYLSDELIKKNIEIDSGSRLKITITIIPVFHKFSGETIPMMVGYQASNDGKQVASNNYLEVVGFNGIRKHILKDLRKRDNE